MPASAFAVQSAACVFHPLIASIGQIPGPYWLAPAGALAALGMALFFYRGIMRGSEGDQNMIRIARAVREGAYAYLSRQRLIVIIVFAVLIAGLFALAWSGLQHPLTPVGVAVAGTLSGLCGYFGMKTATNASARTTAAARESLNDGLRVAFRAGAVMGLCVTGFALLDISCWFLILTQLIPGYTLVTITTIMLSYGMGASLQALFARVGGGIYTKAADVGADLVGKVEAGIPEDDARNPATIADNVGDNVGDVAGMGADLYESYYDSILAAMALAAAAALRLDLGVADALALVVTPPALAGVGILCSIASIFLVRARENATFAQLLTGLHRAVWVSSALIVLLALGLFYWLLGGIAGINWWGVWGAIVAGLLAGLIIAWGTEHYTSYERKPTQRIGKQAETGPATVIIAGVAEGMLSTWIPLLAVVAAIICAFTLAGGGDEFLMGVFGVGLAAVGMLSTLGVTLATDAYGPVADNAGGNAEMTHQQPFVRERTDMLDSLGNTTAATGKGFAIGSAALTALALLAAYVATVQNQLSAQALAAGVAKPISQTIDAGPHEQQPMTYNGRGVFQVIDPQTGKPSAGLLLDQSKQRQIEANVPTHAAVSGDYDPTAGVFRVTVPAAGDRALEFDVAPASSATLPQIMDYYDVTLINPQVLCGLFLGVMLVFVFCALTMNAVGRAAYRMMNECRRQFDIMKRGFTAQGMSEADIADPLKWPYEITVDGHQYPDYATCVDISTAGSLREMVVPSLLAVIVPIVVGLVLGVAGVVGMLAGTLVTGFAIAIFMANAGGAWDNAKKYIETGEHGGKGSEAHRAGIVGDTVGDPFKDTSGPSLNILIKLVSIVSVVFAGLIVEFSPYVSHWLFQR